MVILVKKKLTFELTFDLEKSKEIIKKPEEARIKTEEDFLKWIEEVKEMLISEFKLDNKEVVELLSPKIKIEDID